MILAGKVRRLRNNSSHRTLRSRCLFKHRREILPHYIAVAYCLSQISFFIITFAAVMPTDYSSTWFISASKSPLGEPHDHMHEQYETVGVTCMITPRHLDCPETNGSTWIQWDVPQPLHRLCKAVFSLTNGLDISTGLINFSQTSSACYLMLLMVTPADNFSSAQRQWQMPDALDVPLQVDGLHLPSAMRQIQEAAGCRDRTLSCPFT